LHLQPLANQRLSRRLAAPGRKPICLPAGTQLLWLVYPEQQEVQEYRQGHLFHIYRINDELDGHEVMPGFRYALRDLFA
jgi:Uma2 family endonuclease